ncbi:sensor histidine kinase [Nocardia farcinica]|uniref:sensor histidine kinase n=1 Tax=Nocardia farcinica TaxID=37329 RepID=UPI002458BB52|nr:histidine kinase [Nocardia farcinica]
MSTAAITRIGRDWGLALVVAVAQVGLSRPANLNQTGVRALDLLGYLLLVAGPIALVFRRRAPLPVLAVTLAACAGYLLGGYGYGPVFLALVVAFLTAATRGSRWWTYPLLPIGYLAFVWPLPVLLGETVNGWQLVGIGAWLAVLGSIAEGVRQRRAAVEARAQRAEAARRDAEAQRRRRASEERLSIARELHDVLAHSLSLINVQSSVALALFDAEPEQARSALAAIKTASKDSLAEVHTLLETIRAGAPLGPPEPAPGIGDPDALVRPARDAGLAVRVTVRGEPRPLPSVIDVAAARIVREALTNVVRHAPGAAAQVCVRYGPASVEITVDNTRPLRTAARSGGGSGIAGMRERAHALGGTVTAGPRPDGGFRVAALLPVAPRETAAATGESAHPEREGR